MTEPDSRCQPQRQPEPAAEGTARHATPTATAAAVDTRDHAAAPPVEPHPDPDVQAWLAWAHGALHGVHDPGDRAASLPSWPDGWGHASACRPRSWRRWRSARRRTAAPHPHPRRHTAGATGPATP